MNCCGCNRDVVGVLLGCFYFMGSSFLLIYVMVANVQFYNEWGGKISGELIEYMIVFGLAAVISYLYIVAIEERHVYLILPWFLFALFFLLKTLKSLFRVLYYSRPLSDPLARLVCWICLFFLTIEIITIWNSVLVFKKIRHENIERREHQLSLV